MLSLLHLSYRGYVHEGIPHLLRLEGERKKSGRCAHLFVWINISLQPSPILMWRRFTMEVGCAQRPSKSLFSFHPLFRIYSFFIPNGSGDDLHKYILINPRPDGHSARNSPPWFCDQIFSHHEGCHFRPDNLKSNSSCWSADDQVKRIFS